MTQRLDELHTKLRTELREQGLTAKLKDAWVLFDFASPGSKGPIRKIWLGTGYPGPLDSRLRSYFNPDKWDTMNPGKYSLFVPFPRSTLHSSLLEPAKEPRRKKCVMM